MTVLIEKQGYALLTLLHCHSAPNLILLSITQAGTWINLDTAAT
jgi:hypothetical protein